jgi:hypothetical protein
MTKHSNLIGGSTAGRAIQCPASIQLVQSLPPTQVGTDAHYGTLLHEAIALILDDQVEKEKDVIGLEYKGLKLTEQLYEQKIQPALNGFDSLKLRDYVVEVRVEFEKDIFGTADIIGITDEATTVLDFKFGEGVMVPAENNPQCLFYAVSGRRTPKVQGWFQSLIDMVIIQPARGELRIDKWRTDSQELDRFELLLKATLRKAQREDAEYQSGPWCRFCPGAAVCPALTQSAIKTLQRDIPGLTVEAMGELLHTAREVEYWIAELRKLAHQKLEAGVSIPGWKLVGKRATKRWRDETVAEKKLLALGLPLSELYSQKLISPAQAQKVARGTDLSDLFELHSSGTTLAPEDDPRPEIPGGGIAFEALSDHLTAKGTGK